MNAVHLKICSRDAQTSPCAVSCCAHVPTGRCISAVLPASPCPAVEHKSCIKQVHDDNIIMTGQSAVLCCCADRIPVFSLQGAPRRSSYRSSSATGAGSAAGAVGSYRGNGRGRGAAMAMSYGGYGYNAGYDYYGGYGYAAAYGYPPRGMYPMAARGMRGGGRGFPPGGPGAGGRFGFRGGRAMGPGGYMQPGQAGESSGLQVRGCWVQEGWGSREG